MSGYEELLERASSVIDHSYAPYSGFRVASAVRAGSGRIYVGVNVENASYGLTVCAERVAVFNAISSGERVVSEVLVASYADDPIPPCGACLQVLGEFAKDDVTIHSVSLKTGKRATWTLRELMPRMFSSRSLSKRGAARG